MGDEAVRAAAAGDRSKRVDRCVVAVDGPSGSGKSTVSRRLAGVLGARYLDTGAMYRAVTLAVLTAGADPNDAATVAKIAREARLRIDTDAERPSITLDGVPVDQEIRGAAVTGAVSAVSAVPAVRALLVSQQREIIAGAPRTGRSQALRTIAGSLARANSPADVHLYGLDCGNGALLALTALPHCGAVVRANEAVPTDPDRPLHCRFLGSQAISLVGPASVWRGRSLRVPEDLEGLELALPGPRHALRGQFDALCVAAGVVPRLRAERSDEAVQAALAALTEGARGQGNLLALSVEAARAKATVGEISLALEHAFGRHHATPNHVSGVYNLEAKSDAQVLRAKAVVTAFAESEGRPPKIMIAKMGQDGHDRGQKVVSTAFADFGFDVMVGGLFQGSNDGANWSTLYTVTSQPAEGQYTSALIGGNTAYRYLRYLSPDGGYGNVADVEFYGTGGGSTTTSSNVPSGNQVYGSPIGTSGSWNNSGNTLIKAFDGQLDTYFDAPSTQGWVGYDFGSQKYIASARFSPRAGQAGRMVGGQFQVSNDGYNWSTVATIASQPAVGQYTTINFNSPGSYRYVRYLSPDGGYGNVAELQIFSGTASASEPIVITAPEDAATPVADATPIFCLNPIQSDLFASEANAGL